jgi:hypothetical protein
LAKSDGKHNARGRAGRFVTGEMKNTENILYCGRVAMGYKCFDTNDYILRSFNNFLLLLLILVVIFNNL